MPSAAPSRRFRLAAPLVVALSIAATLLGCPSRHGGARGEAPGTHAPSPDSTQAAEVRSGSGLGGGFAVWESNRSGSFRIHRRDLAGGVVTQLTPDEPGRDHCCPHLSPDGRRMVYLSLPRADRGYHAAEVSGPLRLLSLDSGEVRELAAAARTYFEHRAAVWWSDRELVYIDGDGTTRLLDLESGARRDLARALADGMGWLIDASGRHATGGTPTFSRWDRATREVRTHPPLGGCQPYFSHDGRWGIWVAGAGGPIDRIDLETRATSTVLASRDPRLPEGWGYLYFPMLSRDGSLLAWAASGGEHDHFSADYEVFAAEVDPVTLEVVGSPVRVTEDPATDRFPDLHRPALELGRHAGEAPLRLTLRAPREGAWEWDLGDGRSAHGRSVETAWERPGLYALTASDGELRLRGELRVRPPAPPRLVSHGVDGDGSLWLAFDEPVELAGASFSLAPPGPELAASLSASGREVRLALEGPGPVPARATLSVAGIRDRALRPNTADPFTLSLDLARWPSRRDGLVWLWEAADRENRVGDRPEGERLELHGRAWLGRGQALVLAGGYAAAPLERGYEVGRALRRANVVTLELLIEPAALGAAQGPVVSLGRRPGLRGLLLRQDGRGLSLVLHTSDTSPEGEVVALAGGLEPGRTRHVAVRFSPGRLAAFLDGEPVLARPFPGYFEFHWGETFLLLGTEPDGREAWRGTVSHLAVFARELADGEIADNARRALAARSAAAEPARLEVEARPVARSRYPTLAEISPYRDALVVEEWEVVRTIAGDPGSARLQVVRWAILNGEPVPPGEGTRRLLLEPFAAQPQLESLYLASTLGEDPARPLLFDLGQIAE